LFTDSKDCYVVEECHEKDRLLNRANLSSIGVVTKAIAIALIDRRVRMSSEEGNLGPVREITFCILTSYFCIPAYFHR
jgi:hypothetical protein